MHEGMGGWKENGCPPALEAGVEAGWRGKAGAASDVTRGDWEEGSGRLNGIEALLGRETACLPASHHHHHPDGDEGWEGAAQRTGWISLQSKGLSRVFSNTTPQFKTIIDSLALSFLYSPTLTSIHDHWKNHSLD